MRWQLGILLVSVVSLLPLVRSAQVLVSELIPLTSSHVRSMSVIVAALTRHGHNVTVLTSSSIGIRGFEPGTFSTAIQYHFEDVYPGIHAIEEEIAELAFTGSQLKLMHAFSKLFELGSHSCKCLFDDDATLTKLKYSNFDIVIGDVFDGCDAILAAFLDIPLVAVTTTLRYPFFHEHVYGIPSPSSYVPFGLFPISDKMSFAERVLSYFEHHVLISGIGWFNTRKLNALKDGRGIAPGKDARTLMAAAELWLCVTNFALDFPHPITPNWVSLGGITDSPAKPLSKEYEDFVEGSGEHGFILFSLGTHFPKLPNPEMGEAFARAFSELPQRVLWRCTGPRPRNLGNNTKLVDWLPLNDLLGHPKARLLIYHGGAHGVYEAIYHAVPMVIMPLIGEQSSNAIKVEVKGMGRRLQKDAISYEVVKATLKEVLENQSYAENVRRLSGIHRDTLSKPDETAVFWIEHVLKYGGSHLRTRATELNFIQLNSIDVVAFLLLITCVQITVIYVCCKRLLSCCCSGRGKSKVD